jgi:hypothetical protein
MHLCGSGESMSRGEQKKKKRKKERKKEEDRRRKKGKAGIKYINEKCQLRRLMCASIEKTMRRCSLGKIRLFATFWWHVSTHLRRLTFSVLVRYSNDELSTGTLSSPPTGYPRCPRIFELCRAKRGPRPPAGKPRVQIVPRSTRLLLIALRARRNRCAPDSLNLWLPWCFTLCRGLSSP